MYGRGCASLEICHLVVRCGAGISVHTDLELKFVNRHVPIYGVGDLVHPVGPVELRLRGGAVAQLTSPLEELILGAVFTYLLFKSDSRNLSSPASQKYTALDTCASDGREMNARARERKNVCGANTSMLRLGSRLRGSAHEAQGWVRGRHRQDLRQTLYDP